MKNANKLIFQSSKKRKNLFEDCQAERFIEYEMFLKENQRKFLRGSNFKIIPNFVMKFRFVISSIECKL